MRDTSKVRNAWQAYMDMPEEDVRHFEAISTLINTLAEFAEIEVTIDLNTHILTIIDKKG